MTLNLLDQLTLLALDDEKGVFIPDSTTFSYAIAGAVMLELALEEMLTFNSDRVSVKNTKDTGDIILDRFVEIIRRSEKIRTARHWIEKFGHKSDEIKKDTLAKLIKDGILEKREEKILWVFQVDKYPTFNPKPENQLRKRLHDIVINGQKPNLKEVMLLNLVESCNLEKEVFGKENARTFKKEIKKIKQDDHLAGVVQQSIREICDGIHAMLIIMIATAVTTNVATR